MKSSGSTFSTSSASNLAIRGGRFTLASGSHDTIAGAVTVSGGTMNVNASVAGAGTYTVSGPGTGINTGGNLNLTVNNSLSAATAVTVNTGSSLIFGSGTTNALNTSAIGTLTLSSGPPPSN